MTIIHVYENIEIPIFNRKIVEKYSISIEEYSYIGINALIVGNIRIGKYCVMGAN